MQHASAIPAKPPAQLEDVRVVDLSRILSGPFCTMHLADLGAEVIKVEPPEGDPIRQQGNVVDGLSWYFAAFNRNKRSVRLNLRSLEGMEALRALIATADVVVDNFRPGVMDKMGLGWDALQALRPGIIHTSISGFGQSGPYVHRPAFDFIAQGMSGFMALNGTHESGPMRTGIPISDLVAGTYAALGTVAALMRRQRTGRGERVSAALVDGLLSYGAFSSAHYFATGAVPEPVGNDHALVAPYGLFTAADGEIAIAPSNEGVYNKLMKVLDLQHLKGDPHFATNAARVKNRAHVNAVLDEVLRTRPVSHWLEVLNAAGVPTGIVQDLAGAYADPQVLSQDMLLEVEHPGHGKVKMTGFPLKFTEAPCQVRLPAPDLGADNTSVLCELGYAQAQIAALAADAEHAAQGAPGGESV
ncbi:CaiB/BaiF CoA transferase family protein [Ramlibacter sp.]|uniref:CaiB/BaiF CoA transferase family protein n=1 Tax=Ramlibacter sp. TaxID=1917967 RepID=UPI003D0A5960